MAAEKQRSQNELEFTRDGDLVYIRSNYELIKELFHKKQPSFKMRDKLYLEMEALIKRYQENFSPALDDKLLLDMIKTQQNIEARLGRSFFEEMYNSCRQRFKPKNSVTEDKELLSELVDIIKRYQITSALGENDPLLMNMQNLAEEIRDSIQGERYLTRMAEQYQNQFDAYKDDPEKCEEILALTRQEYQKAEQKKSYTPEALAALQRTLKVIEKRFGEMVKKQGYRELHEIVVAVRSDSTAGSLKKSLKKLNSLSQRIKQFAAGAEDIKEQIGKLSEKIERGLDYQNNSEFMQSLAAIQRQLLYAQNEDDYKRLLELLNELQNQLKSSNQKVNESELSRFREIYKAVQDKYQKAHLNGFKKLFARLQQDISNAKNEEKKDLLKKLSFLIREYDSEYQAASNGDIFFDQMRKYEQRLQQSR